MIEIKKGDVSHAKTISQFQQIMALETQHLKLNKQIVDEAVVYIINNPQYGQYYVAVDNDTKQLCGNLLITYQNKDSWWMQSVFVLQSHRRRGIFTQLFNAVVKNGKHRHAKKMQLFVQKQNKKARITYEKLGMFCNNKQFIGYELVYGDQKIKQQLSKPIDQKINIIRGQKQHQKQMIQKQLKNGTLVALSGKSQEKNGKLACFIEKVLNAYCQYFYQFSDWRFGLVVYINYIMIKQQNKRASLQALLKYIYKNSPFKVAAIRIITMQKNQSKCLKQIVPSLHEDVYDVMQIDF